MRKSVVIFKPGAVPDVPTRCTEVMDIVDAALPTIQGCVGSIDSTRLGSVQGQNDVQVAAFDTQVEATATQTNPPWGLDRIDQRQRPLSGTYGYTDTGAGVKVYVIDSGIRVTNSDFGGRAVSGRDFVDEDNNADDCNGHGTHVAGTIGGTTYGVAKQAQLVALRVLDCNGLGLWTDVIQAFEWVAKNHAAGDPAVVNVGLSGTHYAPADEALKRLVGDKVTVVTSAGNDDDDACSVSPASAPPALTVAASTIDDQRAVYSNFGSCVDLFAPGDGIVSDSLVSNTTKTLSGTSMAAAHVSGVAALVLQNHPAETPTNVRNTILDNVTAGVISDSQSPDHDGLLHSHFSTAPGAPQSVSAAGSDQAATVSWQPPASDGGSPINGYLVSKSPPSDDSAVRVDANARSLVIDGLTNGQPYTFTVKAVNAIGTGPGATSGATPAPTDKADLVVTSVSGSPLSQTDGGAVQFQATIQNIGSHPTSDNTVHSVQFSVDGHIVTASTSFTGPLAPGDSRSVSANTGGSSGRWTAVTGVHQVDAFVDSLGAIVESNEGNNHLATTYTVGPSDKIAARIAYGGSVSLVVWEDSRNARDGGTDKDIYATRIDSTGKVLDPKGIPISNRAGDQTEPTVAWNGESFLVAWSDGRAVAGTDIFSTRVLADGTVTNPNGVSLTGALDDQLYPVARANSDKTWLVVWQDARNGGSGTDIYGQRVDTSGGKLGGNIAVSHAERDQRRPSVAAIGSTWFVVWGDRRPNTPTDTADSDSDIFGARVASNGTVTDPAGIKISAAAGDQSNPSIAANNTRYLVVWSDYRSKTSLDIFGARVSASGQVQNTAGIPIAKTAKSEAAPALSAIGTNWLVTWQAKPAVGGNWDVLGARMSDVGTVTALGSTIAGGGNDQTLPAVGLVGNNYLVAWSERRTTSVHLLGSRITPAGQTLSPGGFAISPTAAK
jgi:subtilisin family serine protease